MENTHSNQKENTCFSGEKCYDFCRAQDLCLLQDIVKAASVGEDSIETVLSSLESGALKGELRDQKDAYRCFKEEAEMSLVAIGADVKKLNFMTKAMMWSSIKLKTAMDDSDSNVADMMIQGVNMGIIDINKSINSNSEIASEPALDLAKRFVTMQQKCVDRLKTFL